MVLHIMIHKVINKVFTSVFTKENVSAIPTLNDSCYPDMPHIQINTEGILRLLLELKPNKAPGPDKIPSRLLKELAYEIAPVLAILFSATLDQSCLPADWKNANVVPIFKKNNRSCPLNYRPVSLTSICCKVLEHIIYSNICKHLEEHSILCKQQHGFRSGHSCETQLINTVDHLAYNLNIGLQTDLVLLDFKKAFDKVPHH